MVPFEKSHWIWLRDFNIDDAYVDFSDTFDASCEKITVRISADSDYALYVNGSFAASKQYGDFEHYKIYDEIDVSPYLVNGENKIDVTAYHTSAVTSRHRSGAAGVIYEVINIKGEVLAASDENTLTRKNPYYESGRCVIVSPQLGYTFFYNACAEENEYERAECICKKCNFYPRPIKRHTVKPEIVPKDVKKISDNHYIVDLGGEAVGFPTLSISSERKQNIRIAWGEHLNDGAVRYLIGNRNFYFEYTAKPGENHFTERFLRLGCRYLEIFSEYPIDIEQVSILPEVYEVVDNPFFAKCELDEKIYGISLNALKLCMMEHYVDCPWREQALYVFDSKNQMLCGYYAFEDKNAEYARANLLLISKDRRDDGLLSITYPTGLDLAIPSFSLYYFLSVREYVEHTGDLSLALEVYEKLGEILKAFLNNTENGLVKSFSGKEKWNFYDWSEYLDGTKRHESAPDLVINCLFIMALDAYEYISGAIGREFIYSGLSSNMRELIFKTFSTPDGRFTLHRSSSEYTALGNALAVLAGVSDSLSLLDEIAEDRVKKSSLSMRIFAYEAMIRLDKDKYIDYILDDIRKTYKKMLDSGSDTVWETERGADDFAGAGSLCHGWSAVPIYVFHRLFDN